MKRTTYLLAALTILLLAGMLWVRAEAAATKAGGGPTTLGSTLPAAGAASSPVEPNTHDPVLIKEGDTYYVFFTGGNVAALHSTDLIHWTRAANLLPRTPAWVATELPGVRGLWAPDIAFYKGKYLLFYAASSFGSRNSAIGLATNKTLDPGSKDYQWEDGGMVIRSTQTDNYNAIDPNFVVDEKGQPWLAFGSFWSGIKLRKLTDEGKPDPLDPTLYALAARAGGSTAIEAPFIIHEGRYYYLFVSWDRCCAGLNSTYRIIAGRAEKITGPYVDKDNVAMAQGGGTQLLAGDGKRIIGPGGQGLFKDGDRWLMVHHFYDGNTPNGTSRLQVRPVTFDERGWPVVGKAMNSPE